MLSIVLTSRLILNLRKADRDNAAAYQAHQGAQWEMQAINKIVDDFDDAPQSTETHMLDTVRRINVRS